jgi:hypothetical protein
MTVYLPEEPSETTDLASASADALPPDPDVVVAGEGGSASADPDAAPPEPKVLTPEEEVAKRRADRLALAEAAEKEAAARRTESRAARQAAALNAEAKAIAAQAARELAAVQRERQELTAARKAIESGGPEALAALGLDYEGLTRGYLEKLDPEHRQKSLEAEVKQLRAEREQERVEAQKAASQAALKRDVSACAARLEVPEIAEKFQAASLFADEVPALIPKAAQAIAAHFGRAPMFDEILQVIDEHLAPRYKRVTERLSPRLSTPASQADPTATSTPSAPRGTSPRTLTNAVTQQRASAREKTEAEIDAELLDELRRASEADSKARR